MRNTYAGDYAPDWRAVSLMTKAAAGWRCIRCRHAFNPDDGKPLPCDPLICDRTRGIHRRMTSVAMAGERTPATRAAELAEITLTDEEALARLSFTVHHFDGDKRNDRWWNRLALCNSCHLKIQSSVIAERSWILEHSEWAKPYIGGFYAWWFAKQEPSRETVEADVDLFLALGQPWLYPDQADRARAYIAHGFIRATDPAALPAWNCATCGQRNTGWSTRCGRCEKARDPLARTPGTGG